MRTNRGKGTMKLLKIEDSNGEFFSIRDNGFKPLDKLNKEELLQLVETTLENEDVEFDPYDEQDLRNKAHQIIYKSVYEKLTDLADRRIEFNENAARLYSEAYGNTVKVLWGSESQDAERGRGTEQKREKQLRRSHRQMAAWSDVRISFAVSDQSGFVKVGRLRTDPN